MMQTLEFFIGRVSGISAPDHQDSQSAINNSLARTKRTPT